METGFGKQEMGFFKGFNLKRMAPSRKPSVEPLSWASLGLRMNIPVLIRLEHVLRFSCDRDSEASLPLASARAFFEATA